MLKGTELSAEIISEIILIVAIFVIGAAILLWSVADGISSTRLKQRTMSGASQQQPVENNDELVR